MSNHCEHWCQKEHLEKEIESLKAITKLTVKALEDISTGFYAMSDCKLFSLSTLEQIKKVSHE